MVVPYHVNYLLYLRKYSHGGTTSCELPIYIYVNIPHPQKCTYQTPDDDYAVNRNRL